MKDDMSGFERVRARRGYYLAITDEALPAGLEGAVIDEDGKVYALGLEIGLPGGTTREVIDPGGDIRPENTGGLLLPLRFMQSAVAASQTEAAVPLLDLAWNAGTSDATLDWPGLNDHPPLPFGGSPIGLSVALSTPLTGGTLTVGLSLNGAVQAGLTVDLDTGTPQAGGAE